MGIFTKIYETIFGSGASVEKTQVEVVAEGVTAKTTETMEEIAIIEAKDTKEEGLIQWNEVVVDVDGEKVELLLALRDDRRIVSWGGKKTRRAEYVLTDKETVSLAKDLEKKSIFDYSFRNFNVEVQFHLNSRGKRDWFVLLGQSEKAVENSPLSRIVFEMMEGESKKLLEEIVYQFDKKNNPESYS